MKTRAKSVSLGKRPRTTRYLQAAPYQAENGKSHWGQILMNEREDLAPLLSARRQNGFSLSRPPPLIRAPPRPPAPRPRAVLLGVDNRLGWEHADDQTLGVYP